MKTFFLIVGLSLMTTAMVGCQDEADAPSTNRTSADTDPVGSEYDPNVTDRPSETPAETDTDQPAPPETPPATDPETPAGTTIDSLGTPGAGQDPPDETPNP